MKFKAKQLSKDTGYSICYMMPVKVDLRQFKSKKISRPIKVNKENVLEDVK